MTGLIDNAALGEISALARMLVEYDREVEDAELALKGLKENARRVREESLPTAMLEIGLDKVVLTTGEKVEVKSDVFAQPPAERKTEMHAWLEEHGFGGLIKTEVSVEYGKGEVEDAKEMLAELKGRGIAANIFMGVHAQTLKAFLREQLEAAQPIPLDLFGARPVKIAKVTLPKGK